MTKPDFKRDLQPGDLVRIDPRNRSKKCKSGHWMRGRVVELDGDDHVIVYPFGHNHNERIKREHVKLWKAKAV